MSSSLKGWIYLLITIFFFSTIEVVTKPYSEVFDPLQLTFLRFLIGGLLLFVYVIFTGKLKNFKLTAKNLLLMGLIGSLNSIMAMSFLQLAVKFSNASTAAIMISTNPIFVIFLAWIILKEDMNFKKILSGIIGLIGISLIILSNNSGDTVLGFVFGGLSAFSFGLYTVFVKKFITKIPSSIFVTFSFLVSSIFFFVFLKIINVPTFTFEIVNSNVIWMLLYISIFVTGIAYITFFKAFEYLDASKGAFSFLLKPVISMVLSYIFLSEIPNQQKILGTSLIILAVAIIVKQKKKT
ncbi:MAG: DMT family transporter [Thermotogota bacterium]